MITEQCAHALRKANEVRLARAELRHAVHDGQLAVTQVIVDTPDEALTMSVSDLLCAQASWGPKRCMKVLVPLALRENKQLGTLTDRQRRVLCDALGGARG